jgi:ankyrin repeat protein
MELFSRLPTELLVAIAENLHSMKEIDAFARTNRNCYIHLNRYLCRASIPKMGDYGLRWAAKRGLSRPVETFIEAGAIDGANVAKAIETVLNLAAFNGHANIVTLLIEYGDQAYGELNPNLYCQNPLGEAIKGDQIGIMEMLLLNNRANLEKPFANGQRSIHLAAHCDNGPIIRLLYDRGVDIYSLDQNHTSALQIAAKNGNLIAIKALLECGFNPNFVDGNGDAPIHGLGKAYRGKWTIKNGNFSRPDSPDYEKTQTSTLLDHGADPYLKDRHGSIALWIASHLGLASEVQTLLEYGVNPDGLDENGNPPRLLSVEEFEEMKKETLSGFGHGDYNYSLDYSLRVGTTPLHMAVLNKKPDLVAFLIQKGASIDAKDAAGQTPLGLALQSGGISVIGVLFESGASIECIDLTGVDPIFRALEYGHSDSGQSAMLPPGILDTRDERTVDFQHTWPHKWRAGEPDEQEECERVIEWFLERGTNVNTQDPLGRTVLHQAAFQHCTESVRLLLKRGANLKAKDSFGQTPLHMACSEKWGYHRDKVPEILLEAGSDPNAQDENGDTPLHLAVRSSYGDGIRMFRRHGKADFMVKNNCGNLPLHEVAYMTMNSDITMTEIRRAYNDCNLANSDGKTIWDLASVTLEDYDDLQDFTDAFTRELPEEQITEIGSGSSVPASGDGPGEGDLHEASSHATE